jgi:hypothetical protein
MAAIHVHSAQFFGAAWRIPFMYPAPVGPLYGFFLRLPHPSATFLGTLVLIVLAAVVLLGIALRKKGLSITASVVLAGGSLALSYPIVFELKQGNMELFVCVLVGLGVWLFLHDRPYAAAVCIGVAGAMKLFPLVYLGLLIARRTYRPIVAAFLAAVVATVGSLYYLDPSIPEAWHGVQSGLALYQSMIALSVPPQIGFDHSLFAILKVAYCMTHRPAHDVPVWLLRMFLLPAAVGGVALYFLRIRNLPVINQVICLSVAPLILLPVSYDYTLMYLYLSWTMLVFFAIDRADRFTPGLRPVFVCLALTTAIETELIFRRFSFGGQFKAAVLVVLMYLGLRHRFQAETADPLPPAGGPTPELA